MSIEIKCHICDAENKLYLIDSSYDGLFRCWKCKQAYMIVIDNDELKYFKPLSDEKFGKQLEFDL